MLSSLVRLRILASDLAFKLASRVPKPIRRYLKAIASISYLFDFLRDDTYRARYAFDILKERQARELDAIAAYEGAKSGSSFHVIIDGNTSNVPGIYETIVSAQIQGDITRRLTIFISDANKIDTLFKSYPALKENVITVTRSQFSVELATQEVRRAGSSGNEEYVLFLNAGEILHKHALNAFRHFIRESENPDAIYSDVVSILPGTPIAECRPKFCPDYLYEYNYLSSSICFKAEFVQDTVLPEVNGAGRVDALNHALAIVLASSGCSKIEHVPFALLESVATTKNNESPISDLSLATLEMVAAQSGFTLQQGQSKETICVQWDLPKDQPLVSIIIPTRDQVALLRQCIESILKKSSYKNIEILVINNNSEESDTFKYFDSLAQDSRIKLLDYPGPFNYSAINNFAVNEASGNFIALINNDIEVINSDWIEIMLSQCARPEVGCVGAKLYYPDDTCQHGGVVIGYGGVAGHAHKNFHRGSKGYMCRLITTQNYTAVTAACLMIKKETFLQVGGLDEANLTVAFNDVDLCLKVHDLGLRNIWTPYAELYHHESVSRGNDRKGLARVRFMQEIEYMKNRWQTENFKDPAYNINLTLNREDFALKSY